MRRIRTVLLLESLILTSYAMDMSSFVQNQLDLYAIFLAVIVCLVNGGLAWLLRSYRILCVVSGIFSGGSLCYGLLTGFAESSLIWSIPILWGLYVLRVYRYRESEDLAGTIIKTFGRETYGIPIFIAVFQVLESYLLGFQNAHDDYLNGLFDNLRLAAENIHFLIPQTVIGFGMVLFFVSRVLSLLIAHPTKQENLPALRMTIATICAISILLFLAVLGVNAFFTHSNPIWQTEVSQPPIRHGSSKHPPNPHLAQDANVFIFQMILVTVSALVLAYFVYKWIKNRKNVGPDSEEQEINYPVISLQRNPFVLKANRVTYLDTDSPIRREYQRLLKEKTLRTPINVWETARQQLRKFTRDTPSIHTIQSIYEEVRYGFSEESPVLKKKIAEDVSQIVAQDE